MKKKKTIAEVVMEKQALEELTHELQMSKVRIQILEQENSKLKDDIISAYKRALR